MPSFFERLFCGQIQTKLDKIHKANITLGEEYTKLLNRIGVLTYTNKALKASVEAWVKEASALKAQIEVLKDEGVFIPDISEYTVDGVPYDVYDVIDGREYRYLLAADLEYDTYTYDQWIAMLTEVQLLAEDRWKTDIYDCDNFAEVMHSYLSLAFKKAGLNKQGMFAIAWGKGHAYNVFMTRGKTMYVYEPQSNEVIGIVGEDDLADRYTTNILLFIH